MGLYRTIVMNEGQHEDESNTLTRLLGDGWKIIYATPIVPAVAVTGSFANSIVKWGKVAYVLEHTSG